MNQKLYYQLTSHGLIPVRHLTEQDFDEIQERRPQPNMPVTWEQLQNLIARNPWLEPHLHLNSGFDPLAILNTNTGEYLDPTMLLLGDPDNPMTAMQAEVVRKHVTEWDKQPSLTTMLDNKDVATFTSTVDRSIILAPNFLKELIYELVPWEQADGMGLAPYHRATALRVRKYEEYPTPGFDRQLVELLRSTEPTDYGDPPEEEVLSGNITIYRGEIDKSHHLALSWTRKREIAEGFAQRFGKHGVVYEATIPADRILAAYASDREREVLVDDLNGIEITKHRM